MIPISIHEFISGTKIPTDLFVRLGEEKFICIARTGQITQKKQLQSFQNKEVQYLWVKKRHYNKISGATVAIAGLAINNQHLDVKTKSKVVATAARTIFRQFDHLGLSVELYNNAKVITEATVSLVDSHRDLHKILEGINENSDWLLKHSMAVSVISVLVGSEIGWTNRLTLEKLALGSLFHDIGLRTMPRDLFEKPLALYSPEEMTTYETHPFKGMQMMHSLGVVPDDVVSIVYEHHENAIGQGYPQRMRDIKIHPLARIVALVDQFCELTMTSVNCGTPKSHRDALMYIEHTMGQPFNKEAFRALSRVVTGGESSQKSA